MGDSNSSSHCTHSTPTLLYTALYTAISKVAPPMLPSNDILRSRAAASVVLLLCATQQKLIPASTAIVRLYAIFSLSSPDND